MFLLLFFSVVGFFFSLFPIVKMNANYAEICRVGKFRLLNFSELFTILLRNINNSKSGEKIKKYFLKQKLKNKINLLITLHRSDQF